MADIVGKDASWSNFATATAWSPVIYSKQVLKILRKSSVAQAITNTNYFGEIKDAGAMVKVNREPEIAVADYTRGKTLTATAIDPGAFNITVDQAKYFMFKVEDLEEWFSHINWRSLSSDHAAYALRDAVDMDVLGYLLGMKYTGAAWAPRVAADMPGTKADTAADDDELLAAHKLEHGDFLSDADGTNDAYSIPLAPGGGSDVVSPLAVLNRFQRLLDEQNVPQENRYFVAPPSFYELLGDENSKLMDHDFTSESEDLLRNGRVGNGMVRGFKLYKSNNMPYAGTGPATTNAAGSDTNYGFLLAGHMGAAAHVKNIVKNETMRDQDTFADIVRGLLVFGRKIIRPNSLLRAKWNFA